MTKNKKQRIVRIIVVYVFIGFIIPIVLRHAVFENDVYSKLSNEGWASFLGSYVGGVLGGLGTLIAMYMTIKQTTEIQEENKKDTDQKILTESMRRNKEYTQNFIDRQNERNEDMANRQWELRKCVRNLQIVLLN